MESATKQAVVEALMRLLNKKAMDDISISELAKEAGISKYVAQYVIHILYHVGMITRIGKKANAYVYKVLDI